MRSRLLRSSVLAALLVAGACRRDGGADPAAPPLPDPPVSTSTTTTAPPDVGTIPVFVDEAYLNRVLEALDAVDGEATRLIVAKKDFVREAADILAAIYGEREFADQSHLWLTAFDEDPDLGSFRADPGNRRTTVQRVISRSPLCVWMAVTRDYSAIAKAPPPPRTEYVALAVSDPADDPKGLNPTAWIIAAEGFNKDGLEPEDQCASR